MDSLNKYMCCLTNKKHILSEAKTLPCNALACLKCIQETTKRSFLACPKCNSVHFILEPTKLTSNTKIDNEIKKSYQKFTDEYAKKLERKVKDLQEANTNAEAMIDTYYDFIKDEIIIKGESLKIQLENMMNDMTQKLEDDKKLTKERISGLKTKLNEDVNSSNLFLKSIAKNKSKDAKKSAQIMQLCETNLNDLTETENDFMNVLHGMKFAPCEKELTNDIFGKLNNEIIDSEKNTTPFDFTDEFFEQIEEERYLDDEDDDDDDDDYDDDDDDDDDDYESCDDDDDLHNFGLFGLGSSSSQRKKIENILLKEIFKPRRKPTEEDFSNFFSQDKEDRDYAAFFGYGLSDDDDDDDDDDEDNTYLQIDKKKYTGGIKCFFNDKGYGFIKRSDNNEDVFLHHSDIKSYGLRPINTNDRVRFGLAQGIKGLKATNVEFI